MVNMWRKTILSGLMTNMGGIRTLLILLFILPIFTGSTYAKETVPCEIIEVSCTPKTDYASSVHYVIIHHKDERDRQRLSHLLKAHSGEQIFFEADDGSRHKGILRRLNSCFGRGIIIYLDNVRLKKKDIINVIFR